MRRVQIDWLVMGMLLGACDLVGCAGGSATNAPAATAPSATPMAAASTPAPPASAAPAEAAAPAPAPEAAGPSPEDEESSANLGEHHRHHHHGGVVMFIAMTLDSLSVSPEQQAAVEKSRETSSPRWSLPTWPSRSS